MSSKTDFHRSNGYYNLPGVNRPINPRDPLGLWDVYFEDRRTRHEEKKEETFQQIDGEKVSIVQPTSWSYADIVKKNPTPNQQGKKKEVVGEKIVTDFNQSAKVSRKRTREQSSPNDHEKRPRKKLCLKELAKLDRDFVSGEQKDTNQKIINSFKNYRKRKFLAKSSTPTYADILKSGKRKLATNIEQIEKEDEPFEF